MEKDGMEWNIGAYLIYKKLQTNHRTKIKKISILMAFLTIFLTKQTCAMKMVKQYYFQ